MTLCRNCASADARATKALCPACYDWARRHEGRARPERIIMRNNQRRHEQETLRRRQLP